MTPTTPGVYWGDVFKRSLITRLGGDVIDHDARNYSASPIV